MQRIPCNIVIEQIAEQFSFHTNLGVSGDRTVDYQSISFLCNLPTEEIRAMHQHPHTYSMGYCTARSIAESFGLNVKQVLGYEPINKNAAYAPEHGRQTTDLDLKKIQANTVLIDENIDLSDVHRVHEPLVYKRAYPTE